MNNFLIDEDILGEAYQLSGDEYHHLKNVLRMKEGDTLYLTTRGGRQYEGRIQSINGEGALIDDLEEVLDSKENEVHISLVQGLLKGDKMDLVIQKTVELGVYEIIPLSLTNCVVRLDEKNRLKKSERWNKISEEAVKQCKRMRIPKVAGAMSLKNYLQERHHETPLIVFYEKEDQKGLKEVMKDLQAEAYTQVDYLVGPEGGLDPGEVQLLIDYGAVFVRLGHRILRGETAAIAGMAILAYELGDLGNK